MAAIRRWPGSLAGSSAADIADASCMTGGVFLLVLLLLFSVSFLGFLFSSFCYWAVAAPMPLSCKGTMMLAGSMHRLWRQARRQRVGTRT